MKKINKLKNVSSNDFTDNRSAKHDFFASKQ